MTLAREPDERSALEADGGFFDALQAADVESLRASLTEDFLIVDVMSGQVAGRDDLLGAIGSGQLSFVDVTQFVDERSVRRHGGTAVVVGRTRMEMRFGEQSITAQSRYTHVYVHDGTRWRMLSAQGTPTQP